MARRSDGLFGRLQEAVTEATGRTVVENDHLELLETVMRDYSALRKELDMLGWSVMDYLSGQPQEVNAQSRRKFAQQCRVVWEQDPQAGAAVEMLNDFVFGRGVPRPRAKDDAVQEVLDEAWDDPDNQAALTSYAAQSALGVDLTLQANLFFVMFDEGDDGKVKLALLDHDTVEFAVRHSENRLRVLYYVAKEYEQEWDYDNDRPKFDFTGQVYGQPKTKTLYYPHWKNVEAAKEEDGKVEGPSADKLAEGKVFHIAINRRTEQIFGTPTMRRTIRWMTAYNDFLRARVDLMAASAAYVMKRKVKGTPTQVANMAAKAVSRESPLAAQAAVTRSGEILPLGSRTASVLTENDAVTHEPFNLNTNAANAAADADMLLGQSAMATPFPKHYYGGDPGALAGATALELPVLKAVESRQEVFESVFRWFLDRVIERAVETGRLDKYADDTSAEDEAKALEPGASTGIFGPASDPSQPTNKLTAAHEDKAADEERTERTLDYEFSMPSPLRRMMTDLVTACSSLAQTFDPNGTNIELSRVLLTVALGEGLEMEDPAEVVERIFPEGYEDPMLKAALAQQEQQAVQPAPSTGGFGSGADPQPTDVANNPYSAPMQSKPADSLGEAAVTPRLQLRDRAGNAITFNVQEHSAAQGAEDLSIEAMWSADVEEIVAGRLERLQIAPPGTEREPTP